ncbi:MAG TPA: ABC transporter permease [Microthrixaceae bacterium]|nr:ABC transporter permease [Microthrixaceae bacterium]HNI34673.1 ABC transporter permease [Microthrixaceae bacterium]
MAVFIIRRLFSLVVTLLGGFTLLFILFFALPSDPATKIASNGGSKNVPAEVVRNVEKRLGLDKPVYEQYWNRLTDTVTLSGESYTTREPVADMVKQRLPASLRLAIFAMMIEATIGIGSGVLSARRRGSIADTITTIAAVVAGAIPVFVLGYLLTLVTGVYAFEHGWPEWARLPAISNNYDPDQWSLFIIPNLDQLELLIQPAVVLASVSTAIVARLTRTTMLEAQTADHVRTARAKGLREKTVSRRHVLRNALIPVVTFIGIDFGTIIGFAILTETVFQWPGLGSKVATAAGQSDLPVVLALSMVVMLIYGLMNLVVDISYAKLDPRIRLGGAK